MSPRVPHPRSGPARLLQRVWRPAEADDGFGMLLVIGLVSVVTIVGVLVVVRGTSLLTGARTQRGWDQAVQLADGAVDDLAYRASKHTATTNVVYPSDYSSWSSSCERTWVRWALAGPAAASAPLCGSAASWSPPTAPMTWRTAAGGSWTWLYPAKPSGGPAGVFYGAGRAGVSPSPSTRVVRVDATVADATFRVPAAVITNTDLQLTGSGKVSGPGGTVHTNTTLTACCNNGVSGNITFSACGSSSTCAAAVAASCTGSGVPSGCQASNSTVTAPVAIPVLTARTYYPKASYVLCAGPNNTGEVHLGPAYTGSLGTPADPAATPCTSGTVVSPPFGAWTYTPASRLWTWNSASTPMVTYYAYGTSVQIQSSATSYGSVVAEGLVGNPSQPCALTGGSVNYQGSGALAPDPAVAPIGILADGPLNIGAAGGAFDGVAYTNQYLTVIGAGGGGNFALVSNDTHQPACGVNVIQGAGGWSYDGTTTLTSTASGAVTQTSWLER